MKLYSSCECGFSVRADDLPDLIIRVRRHARRTHGIELSDEQIIWLSEPVVEITQDRGDRRRDGARPTPPRPRP